MVEPDCGLFVPLVACDLVVPSVLPLVMPSFSRCVWLEMCLSLPIDDTIFSFDLIALPFLA